MQDFNSFMKARDEKVKLLATCEEVEKIVIWIILKNQKNLIMIGPEGDFTKNEIENAINHDFKLVSLGKQTSSRNCWNILCAAFSMIKWYICLVNKVDYTSTILKTLYTFLELG